MLSLEIWNPGETFKYQSIEDEIESPIFGSLLGVGYSTFDFGIKRSSRYSYDELSLTNRVIIRDGRKIVWKGEIACVEIGVSDTIQAKVECDGLGVRLSTRLTTATFGNETLSNWITDHLYTDADLDIPEGFMETDDFEFPFGIDIDAGNLGNYFAEVLEKGNKANGRFYGVWEDGLYYHAYPTTADYEVEAEDAKYTLRYTIEDIVNYLRVSYTADGTNYSYFWWPAGGVDATSEALYRRRDGTLAVTGQASEAQAQAQGTVYLNDHKVMRPQSSFEVTRVISTATGQEVPLSEIKAGSGVHIKDIHPTVYTPAQAQVINELSTFKIAETSCEMGRRAVSKCTISPGMLSLSMEKMLARIEARTKL